MTPSADVSGNTAQYRPDEPDDSDESDAPSKYVAVKNPVNATAAVAVGHALILDQTLALVMPPGSWGWSPLACVSACPACRAERAHTSRPTASPQSTSPPGRG